MKEETNKRQVDIKICVILNGDLVLLKKREDMWELPTTTMKKGENGLSTIKRELNEEFGINISNITTSNEINHDSLTNPWSISTLNNKIVLNYGLCFTSEEITNIENKKYTVKWVPLEDAGRICIKVDDIPTIKKYISQANDDLEYQRVKKYINSIS